MRTLLLALLLVGGVALAQDDGVEAPPREPSEEMLRHCPELKGAIGLRRDQLLALFFELDPHRIDEAKVRALFVLPRDGGLLEGFLVEKGRFRAQTGLRAVVAGLGSAGFAWAIDRFENGKPESRGRALDALLAVEAREAWRLLEARLDDTRAVPDWRAAQEAPPGYKDLRVCDHAVRLLGSKLVGVSKPPETRVSSLLPLDERDARIAKVKQFLASDAAYRAHVEKARSIAAALDAKDRERLGSLGVK